jgi:hypothetical protein
MRMTSDPKFPFPTEPAAIETSPENNPRDVASSGITSLDRDAASKGYSTARLWLRRIGVLLFVFFCATLGVMLMILPWRPEWSDNPLLLAYPSIREAVSTGFVRGLVSGLGLLNVWIGFWEAVRYREDE